MMNELRPGLPLLPRKMRGLHIDKRGFPVPFFVAMINGEPDHRIVDPRAMQACLKLSRCWICGGALGAFRSFVVGPMCAINRISSEPPSHLECAVYAAIACPFMTRPHAKRREAGMPDAPLKEPAGIHLDRNPGVSLIWTTRTFRPFKAPRASGGTGLLFDMGRAESLAWYAEGRAATREEIDHSIATGLPSLIDAAEGDAEGLLEVKRRAAELSAILDKAFA